MFRFASPFVLLLLPLAGLASWAFDRRRRLSDARLPMPLPVPASRLRASVWVRADRAVPWLRGGALALGVVALARPQAGARIETVSSLGVDIMIALDVSGSMRCEDVRSHARLDLAKRTIARFVEGRPQDRIGLVVFGSFATTRCPLTVDHDLLGQFVEETTYAAPGEEGTAIGMGLATAVRRLRISPARSKVVVLVTDGRNNQGQIGPEAAAEAARALGVRVYAIGVGAEGEAACPVDTPLGTRYVYARQDLDEPLLRTIAETTGGRYFRAGDLAGLEAAFAEIDRLEKTRVDSRVRVHYRELFGIPLAPAVALFGLERLLVGTRLRRIP
jgi:Ca-activated chloride channel family protein